MRKRHVSAAAAGAVIACAFATGVTLHFSGDENTPHRPSVVIAHGDQLLPSNTITDWVTYSDHLVLVTVAAQRELAPTAEEKAAGEGYLPRVIDLRIDRVLWSRPSAPPAPASFETDLDGWQFKGDQRTPIRPEGEPMMAVGKHYVVPIVYLSKTTKVPNAGWSTLSPNSIFPYANDTLGKGDVIPSMQAKGIDEPNDARAAFFGDTAGQLVTALNDTPPDPAAADAMDLPPDVRARHAHS